MTLSHAEYLRTHFADFYQPKVPEELRTFVLTHEYPASTEGALLELHARGYYCTLRMVQAFLDEGLVKGVEVDGRNRRWSPAAIDSLAAVLAERESFTEKERCLRYLGVEALQYEEAAARAEARTGLQADLLGMVVTRGAGGVAAVTFLSSAELKSLERGEMKLKSL